MDDLIVFSWILRPYAHLMGEAYFPFFDWQGTLISLSLRVELTSVADGIHVDLFVYCETVDSHNEFSTSAELSEQDFPRFLSDCLGLFQGLVNLFE